MGDDILESDVKREVKKVLDSLAPDLWYYMPVQSGYGVRVLDFIGCYRSKFFSIETKRPTEDLTKQQRLCGRGMRRAGGAVARVRTLEEARAVRAWLNKLITKEGP